MRKDIIIQVNSANNQVLKSNDTLGISSENLQGKIIFKPEPFVDGICRMYVEDKGSIMMDKQEDCYTLDILSSLLTESSLDICFKIIESERAEGTPIFCSKIIHFNVLDTIDNSEEIPEEYPSWEQTLDLKIEELTELEEAVELAEQGRNARVNAEIERLENIVIDYDEDIQELQNKTNTNASNINSNTQEINALKDDVETNSENILSNTDDINDIKQQITSFALVTETGNKIELEINNQTYVMTAKLKDKNNNVISTSNEIDLPLETMVVGASYDSQTKELVITLKNGQATRISIADLVSGLVSSTDIATDNTAGIIKTNSSFGFNLDKYNKPYSSVIEYENYESKARGTFISKGTLENVLNIERNRIKQNEDDIEEINNTIGDIESLLEVI